MIKIFQLEKTFFSSQIKKFQQLWTNETVRVYPKSSPQRYLHLCPRCSSRFGYTNLKVNKVAPTFLVAEKYIGRTAIIDKHGKSNYEDILHHSAKLADKIRKTCCLSDKEYFRNNDRVVFLCENDVSYVIAQWATWILGGVAVPLCKSHPASELEYFVEDAQASIVIATEEYEKILKPITYKFQVPLLTLRKNSYIGTCALEDNRWFGWETSPTSIEGRPARSKGFYDDFVMTNKYKNIPAMIIYTSGTTGRPKGVVLTHGNLSAQITGMIKSWSWTNQDVILHVLPLHHVHGIVNVLMTALHCGAVCVMMPKFDAGKVWSGLVDPIPNMGGLRVNVFMAVPTIYVKLIEYYDEIVRRGGYAENYIKVVCENKIRLMVSGSAALPEPIMKQWAKITGHQLLERYGMTEIGMALSNPLNGERRPGSVGHPMPRVEVCISRPNSYALHGYDVIAQGDSKITNTVSGKEGESGELLVKGPSVFSNYWRKPDATKQAFTNDGWFRTGDTCVYEDNVYKIVGRTSVDIIKSGGFKIGALDIERHLLTHQNIRECAVVGLPDMTWGQKVGAVLVLKDGMSLTQVELKQWASNKMTPYQIPTVVKCLDFIPRNAMGKVNKKQLIEDVFPEYAKQTFAVR
ncbi:hypothetical protein SNE40_008252 [Patella caerulea]|uniref:Uncharacterized protein n=1 Tax=Patella caerulea TaxID=87958 RepID=A0AAN8K6C1_PATCE